MIYKDIIIIDDEKAVVEGLKKLIDWNSLGYNEPDSASSSTQAYNMIEENLYDVVITDIRMPVMNGLELMEKIKANHSKLPKFIILSGFDDFSYAKKAIRLGAVDYLVKPVDEDELSQILIKTHKVLLSDELLQKQNMFADSQIISLALDGTDNNHVKDALKMLIKCDNNGKFQCVLLHCTKEYRTDLLEVLTVTVGENVYQLKEDYTVLVLCNPKNGTAYELYETLNESINKGKITMIAGSIEDKENTVKSFSSAGKLRDEIFYSGYGSYIDGGIGRANYVYMDISIPEKNIMECIDDNSANNLNLVIAELFDKVRKDNVAKGQIWSIIALVKNKADEKIKKSGGSYDIEQIYCKHFNQQDYDLNMIKKAFNLFCTDCMDLLKKARKNSGKGVFNEIIAYINQHYNDNITLKLLAEKYYFNPIYLGKLFKSNTGSTFSKYLHEFRVKKACELLKDTDDKIYEIAESVGYCDSDYFALKFKAITGKTPRQYRNTSR